MSLIGTWMQQIAMSWLVYRLTGSSAMLGFVTFLTQVPILFLSPFMGVLTDRFPLKRLIILTQGAALVQAAVIAYLTLTDQATIPIIAVLSLVLGTITALDMPVRQAFVIELVDDRADLPNALALHSALVNVARLAGPAIAGILVAVIGEGWCFALNAVSYGFVLIALINTRVRPRDVSRVKKSMRRELVLGLHYLQEHTSLLMVVLLVASMSMVGNSYFVIMPVFADRVMGGGAYMLGFLMAASGAGALIGALGLARRKNLKTLHRSMWWSVLLLGVFLVGLSVTPVPLLAFALMAVTGFCLVNINAGANLYLQSSVDDAMRGRVMSWFSLAFLGVPALGGLFAGYLSQLLGVAAAICILGSSTVISAIVFRGRIGPVRAID